MKLDRNICSKCGEKNFRDEDFVHSSAVCKKCYKNDLDVKEEVVAYRSILHLMNIDVIQEAPSFIQYFIIASFLFIPFTFQYNTWWFLKAVVVLILFSLTFMIIWEIIENKIIYQKLKILKEKEEKLSVSEEIYQKYNAYDIYNNSFIISKTDNAFIVISLTYLKEYKNLILNADISESHYLFRTLGIGIFIYVGVFIFFHWMGNNNSVYLNTVSPVDLTKESNWVIPSKKSCEAHEGTFNQKTKECKASWINAKLICKDNSGSLATFDEYEKSQLFTLHHGQWTNTAAAEVDRLIFNATLGLVPIRNIRYKERISDFAYSNEITNSGLPKVHSTDEKLIVNCVKGTNDYYLRNFDTK